MKKLKKLVMVSLFSFVLFFSIFTIFQEPANAASCPTTYDACLLAGTCWLPSGDPNEGCCVQTHSKYCDQYYPDCLNGYCW